MTQITEKLWNGHKVKEEKVFEPDGTFGGFYNAEYWAKQKGLSAGSMDSPNPIGLMKGKYSLPQKWHNLTKSDKSQLDGVIISDNFRNGSVKVILFEDKKVL